MEDNRILMRATPEWMYRKYQEMNDWLFGGKLGDCNFEIFTSGKGSQGGVLGWFCMNGGRYKIKGARYNHRLFVTDGGFANQQIWITKDNFVHFCHPTIKLNGNYQGTEESLLATLVHEMCHYYTYMYGWFPAQAHGTEFRNIAYVVSSRSNGMFSIERVASAEEMKGYELDDEFKQKREKRLETKKSKVTCVVVYEKNGDVTLTNATSQDVVDFIVNYHKNRNDAEKILASNDANLVDFVFSKGYNKTMRTYRYWTINNHPEIIEAFNNNNEYNIKEIWAAQ